jgi:ELWxxDGT repeat protein
MKARETLPHEGTAMHPLHKAGMPEEGGENPSHHHGSHGHGEFCGELEPPAPGAFVFTANGELWISEGSAATTRLLVDINPDGSSSPGFKTPLGDGRVLFSALDPVTGFEPWITDGTLEGTHLVKDINPGAGSSLTSPASSSQLRFLAFDGNHALFSADDGLHGNEMWITDGTSAGTFILTDLNAGAAGSNPLPIIASSRGGVLFQADDGLHGPSLWVTDGTAAGTSALDGLKLGSSGSIDPSAFLALRDGRVIFRADDGVTGLEPWITDGTPAGTYLLHDVNPGSVSSNASLFVDLGNGKVIFRADDGAGDVEPWIT